MKSSWYRIKAQDTGPIEVLIYDFIDMWGVRAEDFKREFEAAAETGRDIVVDITSPGGDVFDGMAIYNTIAKYRDRVTVNISGVAASIASVIALAGASLRMAEGTFFMIHNPWSMALGEAKDLRARADTLDKIRGEIIGVYSRKTGMKAEEIGESMDSETWYTPEEAYTAGFADEIAGTGEIAAAAFDWTQYRYENTPSALIAAKRQHDRPKTERHLEQSLTALGYSNTQAERIAHAAKEALGEPAPTSQGEPDYASSMRELNQLIEGDNHE